MYITRLIFFLILNFAALGIGAAFTEPGVKSDWYLGLNKAPWTPVGWMFGVAWTLIMICFSFYMCELFKTGDSRRKIVFIYLAGLILNVSWNMIFFRFHQVEIALLVIALLFMTVLYFLMNSIRSKNKLQILLIAPYAIWLVLAISLNAYVIFMN